MTGSCNGNFVLVKTVGEGQREEGVGRLIQRSDPKFSATGQNLEEEAHVFV